MQQIKVALISQPNVGASTLINAICDSDLKVGNFAGVTVEASSASKIYDEYELIITELPGIYCLNGYQREEKIADDYLLYNDYDVILNVLDATALQRNLILSTQLINTGKKMLMALNMSDEAQSEGIKLNTKALGKALNIECIDVCAQNKENIDKLVEAIISTFNADNTPRECKFSKQIEYEISKIATILQNSNAVFLSKHKLSSRYLAIKMIESKEKFKEFEDFNEARSTADKAIKTLLESLNLKDEKDIFIKQTSEFADTLSNICLDESRRKPNITHKIDAILTNKYLGLPIFLFFIWLLFWLTFTLGEYPMNLISDFITWSQDTLNAKIKNETLQSLICDGIIGGCGSVLLFLPNILLLFFGIALLEGSGYMPRASFLLDGIFHRLGMHGRSFIPLVTGFGCSVPAFMAARSLKSRRDRLITLFSINFMSCGARLPIYVLLIGAFVPSQHGANWLFAIYMFSAIVGLICAKILSITAFKGSDEPFIMEMPKYRIPNWRLVFTTVLSEGWMYLRKIGTFVLGVSIIMWYASSYPQNTQEPNALNSQDEMTQNVEQDISNSYLARVGKSISPVFDPLGMGWEQSVALLSGLGAKEAIISTLGVLYSAGKDSDEKSLILQDKLRQKMSLPTALSFLLFVMFYNPCLAATTAFWREAGNFKYVMYLFVFTTGLAYMMAFLGYNLAKMFI
ncbi:MAG: ferrous iron transport protein B [Campylobacter sp.]|nr:ferrous iron transport protein B [Campylobacter sp.]